MKDEHLSFVYNYADPDRFHVTSDVPMLSGEVSLRYEFEPTREVAESGPPTPDEASAGMNRVHWGVPSSCEIEHHTREYDKVLDALDESVSPAVWVA